MARTYRFNIPNFCMKAPRRGTTRPISIAGSTALGAAADQAQQAEVAAPRDGFADVQVQIRAVGEYEVTRVGRDEAHKTAPETVVGAASHVPPMLRDR